MDKSTFTGLIGGFLLIGIAILSRGDLLTFIDLSSFAIVMGGVVCATIANYGLSELKESITTLQDVFKVQEVDLRTDIEIMNMFAKRARKEGLLKLEDDVIEIDDEFLQQALQMAIDGVDVKNLKPIMDDQISSVEKKHDTGISILYSMAEYAPAFGMIGTIIGLVLMLQNIEDPASLGAGISVALITTLYGTIFANLVFSPLAGKFEHLSEIKLSRMRMFKAGVVSVMNDENPRIMEKKMLNFVPAEQRAEYLRFYDQPANQSGREDKLYENWTDYQFRSWADLKIMLGAGS